MEFAQLQMSTGLYLASFDTSDMIQLFQRAVKNIEETFGADYINASYLAILINLYELQSKPDDTVKNMTRNLELQEEFFGVDHVALLAGIFDIARDVCVTGS